MTPTPLHLLLVLGPLATIFVTIVVVLVRWEEDQQRRRELAAALERLDFSVLTEALNDFAATIGRALIPAVEQATEAMKAFTCALRAVSEGVPLET